MSPEEIKNFRKKYNITQEELADITGVTASAVRSWEQGYRNIGEPAVKLIKNYELTHSDSSAIDYTEQRRNKKNADNEKTIDFYEVGANASTKHTGETIPVSRPSGKLVVSDLFKGSQFALRVAGNSMTPNYPPGAIIGISLVNTNYINPGTVYVIETVGGEIWIKRLFYHNNSFESGKYDLVSDNTILIDSGDKKGELSYPTFALPFEQIKNIFRVTGIFKSNIMTIVNGEV